MMYQYINDLARYLVKPKFLSEGQRGKSIARFTNLIQAEHSLPLATSTNTGPPKCPEKVAAEERATLSAPAGSLGVDSTHTRTSLWNRCSLGN